MEKMLRETHLKYPHALRILLMIAVAIGTFWLGLNNASASCGYDYNAGYPWFVSTQCWYDVTCDDLSGETC